MHELSLAESMLRMVEQQLGRKCELISATVTIGPLSGVSADALSFCFTEVADQMGFGRPELVVRQVPANATCGACGTDYDMPDPFTTCPECDSIVRTLTGGDQLTLDSVEVEMEDDDE